MKWPARARVCLILALGLITACSNILGLDEVRIRVHNASAIDFESTVVDFSRQTEQYGAVHAGETSDYRTVNTAYSYAYVEVLAGGNRHVMQPEDYVGEKPLKGGAYTYELSFYPGTSQLTQRLVRD